MTISTHLNHLIQGEAAIRACSTCLDLASQGREAHVSHEEPYPHCFSCRVVSPGAWGEAFLADVQAEFRTALDEGEMSLEDYQADLTEFQAAVVKAVGAKVTTSGDLGEEIMNNHSETTAERLEREAEEILAKSDEQLAAEVDAKVTVEEQADAADANFADEFKNLFEAVDTGESLALPAGQYPVRIVGCSYRLSSQGKRTQLVVTAEVGKGEYKGTLIEKYLTMGTTDKAKAFFAGQLRVLGIDSDTEATGWREIARLIADMQTPVWAEVGPQQLWQGKAKTNVKWFNAVSAPTSKGGE